MTLKMNSKRKDERMGRVFVRKKDGHVMVLTDYEYDPHEWQPYVCEDVWYGTQRHYAKIDLIEITDTVLIDLLSCLKG